MRVVGLQWATSYFVPKRGSKRQATAPIQLVTLKSGTRPSAEQVKARVGEIAAAEAAGGGVAGIPSPTGKEGFIKAIDNMKRSDLHHLTTNWEGLLAPAAPVPSSNPLIGKSFEMLIKEIVQRAHTEGGKQLVWCESFACTWRPWIREASRLCRRRGSYTCWRLTGGF